MPPPQSPLKAGQVGYLHDGTRTKTFGCNSEQSYRCQLQVLILLHARHQCVPRPIAQNDAGHLIKTIMPKRAIAFEDFVCSIGSSDGQLIPRAAIDFDDIWYTLLTVLHYVHDQQGIYFPISAKIIALKYPPETDRGTRAKLFLNFNEKAKWGTRSLSKAKEKQIGNAEKIIRVPLLLFSLQDSVGAFVMLPDKQHVLVDWFARNLYVHHLDLCVDKIEPLVPKLADYIMLGYILDKQPAKVRDVLSTFFDAGLLLPKFELASLDLYREAVVQRGRVIRKVPELANDSGMRVAFAFMTCAEFVHFICYKAQATTDLGEPGAHEWQVLAMRLYADLIGNAIKPRTMPERMCRMIIETFEALHKEQRSNEDVRAHRPPGRGSAPSTSAWF